MSDPYDIIDEIIFCVPVFCQCYYLYLTSYNNDRDIAGFVLTGTPGETDGSLPSRRPAAVSRQQAPEYKI